MTTDDHDDRHGYDDCDEFGARSCLVEMLSACLPCACFDFCRVARKRNAFAFNFEFLMRLNCLGRWCPKTQRRPRPK